MNRCAYQQKVLVGCVGVGEIRQGDIFVSDGVVCPKPRRIGLFNSSCVHADEPIRPSRYLQINNQQPEACELKAGTELLDIILTKGSYDVETTSFEMASSPPFLFGSPPTRASNPLIRDAQFGNGNFVPVLEASNPLIRDAQFGNGNFVPVLEASNPLIRDAQFGNSNFVPVLEASNPLIRDAQFGNGNFVPVLEASNPLIRDAQFGSDNFVPVLEASNPLIRDAQFGNGNFVPVLEISDGAAAAPLSPPSFTPTCALKSGGGCVPVKFGHKPAAVRIEGFNCCSSISVVA